MTIAEAERLHNELEVCLKAGDPALASLIAECKTRDAFTREEQTLILDVVADYLDVSLLLIRQFIQQQRSRLRVYPLNDQHIAQAKRVMNRVLELERQLCGV